MLLQEVVLCSTAPSTSSSGPGSVTLHDIQTGASLASFKQTSASINCTAVCPTRNGEGGFVLAAQPEKSIMNVYNFQKDQLALKIVLPEKLSCIAIDPRGDYCAGGTSQGRVYLWEIASGIMYNAWDAHYRQVNVLRFTHDSAALLSGSEDSAVGIWCMSRLLDDSLQHEPPTPFLTLTDHTLPVTDIACGIGLFPTCRILTASVDHSVKLWDLSSNTLLTTFQFPHPIRRLAWDVTERLFFAASEDSIHQVNLFRQREDKFSRVGMEAVGGAGSGEMIIIDQEGQQESRKRLIKVGEPIATLTTSLTTSLLLAGTHSGLILIYDIASHQLLRTISTHKGYSITYLSTMLKPPDLVGHVSLSLSSAGGSTVSAGGVGEPIPVKPVTAFQRIRDPKTRDAHDVLMMLPVSASREPEAFFDYPMDEVLRDQATFVPHPALSSSTGQNSASQPSGVSLQSRVADLEAEVAKLREQLGKAKSINDTMWETIVQKMVSEGKGKSKTDGASNGDFVALNAGEEAAGDAGEGKRKKKRTRT
ncbi:WD40 repeat-like protein [Panus rudis PR-1116 ss-1]|nr:WD40 repeat-like protein [Panus rudis PR-1116 ss-1]